MKRVLLFILPILFNTVSAQDSYPFISFELGYNYQQTKMKAFNQNILEPLDNSIYGILEPIKKSQSTM